MSAVNASCIRSNSIRNGNYYFYHQDGPQLFCDNETNNEYVYNGINETPFVKDGINNFVVNRKRTINRAKKGTKAAVWYKALLNPGASRVFKVRLSRLKLEDPWADFDEVFNIRMSEYQDFYASIIPEQYDRETKKVIHDALAGLLWTKQFYYLDVFKWLFGEPGDIPPHRLFKRNFDWQHLTNRNIISMPDKWEYPWYAVWDLAFHTISFTTVDPDFAKEQLLLVLREYYMHPNGQIPAYEWNFSDVNPPVHSYAVWEVFARDKKETGNPDYDFLERAFQKLLINFTWWVNQKDKNGNDLFEGGFLGLDNIGVFDRNSMPPGITNMQQSDATSWMAMFALNMLRMSLELAHYNRAYEESAAKFFRHFLNIAWAMHHIGEKEISLWDDEDAFYYDVVMLENGENHRMSVRSLVGIIPLFAVEIIHSSIFDNLVEFKTRATTLIRTRPDLASLISRIEETNPQGDYLFSIMRGYRLEHLLKRMLDENEFLSEYGIRSLSKYHLKNPFVFEYNGNHKIQYEPGVSLSDMFGGNSNWRGPIWLPINYMIIKALKKYYRFYGPTYIYEFPTGSGNMLNLKQIAFELTQRLLNIFKRDNSGKYNYHNAHPNNPYSRDKHFNDLHLFYEFFDGDSGQGLGASHQTGWTALIANLLLELNEEDSF